MNRRRKRVLRRTAARIPLAMLALACATVSNAASINTNNPADYAAFAAGATVQNFEATTVTPFDIDSYGNALNSSTVVPAASQLSLDIPGLLFHSGGGSFNNPNGNPGTPTALLRLEGGIAGDARSPSNVVGSLEINSDLLDLDNFIEIVFIDALQSRVGVWLNPSLGDVTMTAFDAAGTSLENVIGTQGNFVGFDRPTADIRFVSIVSRGGGFTVDDLTYAGQPSTNVPAPEFALLALGLGLCAVLRRRTN